MRDIGIIAGTIKNEQEGSLLQGVSLVIGPKVFRITFKVIDLINLVKNDQLQSMGGIQEALFAGKLPHKGHTFLWKSQNVLLVSVFCVPLVIVEGQKH